MTGDDYKRFLAAHKLTQAGAASLFAVSCRTSRYWAKWGPPVAVGIMINLITKFKIPILAVEIARDKVFRRLEATAPRRRA